VYGTPVRNIADTWAASRANGRSHEGTDIFAERGTPIFSATRGYVTRRNIGTRGGKNVMVTGPGGVRYYYAHFSEIASGIERGKPVTQDTVLGFVGNSGNASGTPPHLHFGVYPDSGSWEARNPYPQLINR
jgi:murein DD-endopeptidase MepM/ murein hydrolase activator NlpD